VSGSGRGTWVYRYKQAELATPTAPSILSEPASLTVNEGEDATFSVVISGSNPLSYQWSRTDSTGTAVIAGATSASYTLSNASSSDSGSTYHVEVTNSQGSISSEGAVLTVVADTIAPTLVSAVAASNTRIDIRFSKAVNINDAENSGNYQIDLGISVISASLSDEGLTVSLTLSELTTDTSYTVSVSNIQDRASTPNTIAALSSESFTYRDSDGFEDGNADGWTPLTVSRWQVVLDEGNFVYWLNTTVFDSLPGQRLGEYSLLAASYGDFTFTAKAKLGDPISRELADYAVIFGYQDPENYYYVMFNNQQSATQLSKVSNGSRIELVTADSDWLKDNDYHKIEVSRAGSEIKVYFDSRLILSANDDSLGAGKIGVGSYNDSAYFDDVSVTGEVSKPEPDSTPPVITLVGSNPQTITVGTSYTELGATAMDNVDGNLSGNITIDVDVNTTLIGSYSVTYNVSDAAGNTAIQMTRTVNVISIIVNDNDAPVITLSGADPQEITAGDFYVELGATAIDTVDGNLSNNIMIDVSEVDATRAGPYNVTYRVSDAAGNVAQKVRSVNVVAVVGNEVSAVGDNGGGGALGWWVLVLMFGFQRMRVLAS